MAWLVVAVGERTNDDDRGEEEEDNRRRREQEAPCLYCFFCGGHRGWGERGPTTTMPPRTVIIDEGLRDQLAKIIVKGGFELGALIGRQVRTALMVELSS